MLTTPDDVDHLLLGQLLELAQTAASAAAEMLKEQFGRERSAVNTKSSPTDMVSEMDRSAESLIDRILVDARPRDGLLGEEGAVRQGSSGIRWVVDPLDGTTNYLFDVPAYAVSIAAEVAGFPVVGVVADPSRNETWTAVYRAGSWCNGRAITAARGRSTLSTALVGTGFSYEKEPRSRQAALLQTVLPEVRDIRRAGSAALDLCWVAGGRYDAFYEWGLNPWDYAAGRLVCTEAGATFDIIPGKSLLPGHTILAAAPGLREPMVDLLERAELAASPAFSPLPS